MCVLFENFMLTQRNVFTIIKFFFFAFSFAVVFLFIYNYYVIYFKGISISELRWILSSMNVTN